MEISKKASHYITVVIPNSEIQLEQFSNHCRKKDKQKKQRNFTANENEASNQSEHEANTCKPRKAREIRGCMR